MVNRFESHTSPAHSVMRGDGVGRFLMRAQELVAVEMHKMIWDICKLFNTSTK